MEFSGRGAVRGECAEMSGEPHSQICAVRSVAGENAEKLLDHFPARTGGEIEAVQLCHSVKMHSSFGRLGNPCCRPVQRSLAGTCTKPLNLLG